MNNFRVRTYNDGIPCVEGFDGERFEDDLFFIKGTLLSVGSLGNKVEFEIPDWLADGIRELVKNKMEQDKADTVSQEK